MPRPSRARRILKWSGFALSLIVIAAWGFFLPYQIILSTGANDFVSVAGGFINFGVAGWQHNWTSSIDKFGMMGFGFQWPMIVNRPSENYFAVCVPFWLLLFVTSIPTAWLWHRDRRRIRPGCCQRCGYDLTGNTSGVCPECGDKVHPPAVLADSECGLAKLPPENV